MRVLVLHRRLELCDEGHGFIHAPLQRSSASALRSPTLSRPTHLHDFGEQKKPPPFGALVALQQIPAADLLHFLVAAPAPERDFVLVLRDVDEAGIDHEFFGTLADLERLAQLLADADEGAGPLAKNVVWRTGPVVGFELNVHFDLVDPAAGREMALRRIARRELRGTLVGLHGTTYSKACLYSCGQSPTLPYTKQRLVLQQSGGREDSHKLGCGSDRKYSAGTSNLRCSHRSENLDSEEHR